MRNQISTRFFAFELRKRTRKQKFVKLSAIDASGVIQVAIVEDLVGVFVLGVDEAGEGRPSATQDFCPGFNMGLGRLSGEPFAGGGSPPFVDGDVGHAQDPFFEVFLQQVFVVFAELDEQIHPIEV
jgi:hypothetical protein